MVVHFSVDKYNPLDKPPVLVSFDWHEDTTAPEDEEKRELIELANSKSKFVTLANEIALFAWLKLNPLNDGHILSAAYLNLISDIFIVCKQEHDVHLPFTDMYGNVHQIYSFHNSDDMFKALSKHSGVDKIYLDIDLDYFTESTDSCGGGENVTLNPPAVIEALFNPKTDLMQFILKRLAGMTIAIEPEFCDGYTNAHSIYQVIEKTMFEGQLLSDYKKIIFKA